MRKKLGEILVETGAATHDDVEEALREQSAGEPNRLGDLLVANGKLSPRDLALALSHQYKLPFVELPALPQAIIDLVPLELQLQFRFVPLEQKDTELTIAMADLANLEVVATLEQTWTRVHVCVAASDEIDALHATLSGLFISPVPPPPSPLPARASPKAEDLFGDLNLESSAATGIPVKSTPIAPLPVEEQADAANVAALFGDLNLAPPPAEPQQVEQAAEGAKSDALFGDLNLEPSAPTGIPVQASAPDGAKADALFGDLNLEPSAPTGIPVEPAPDGEPINAERLLEAVIDGEPVESSGPVPGPREGTGSILAMLADGGTGPVVDTPFKSEVSVGALVPSQPLPFASQSPVPAAVAASSPSVPGEMPDWLGESAPAVTANAWTGALDHLAPSKLVIGLTRALLAKGVVTEDEILAALGVKK